jgi:hypothetical protein
MSFCVRELFKNKKFKNKSSIYEKNIQKMISQISSDTAVIPELRTEMKLILKVADFFNSSFHETIMSPRSVFVLH